MHFTVVVTGNIPVVQEDMKRNRKVEECIQKLESMNPSKGMETVVHAIYLAEMRSSKTAFSKNVRALVDEIMEPYSLNTDDPELLEFEDHTPQLKEEYQTGCSNFLCFPNGVRVNIGNYPYYGKFVVRDGKVYERKAGPLQHMKRTKSAKKMKVLLSYPYAKAYKSLAEYVEGCSGCVEENGQYGLYFNPNARHDGYSFGDHWTELFLVRDDCAEYSEGHYICWPVPPKCEAPEGYMWVCAARKKDIAWDKMRECIQIEKAEQFNSLKRMYECGKLDDNFVAEIVEDGIVRFGDRLYFKDESFDDFLHRSLYSPTHRYPFYVHSIVDEEQWLDPEDCIKEPESDEYREHMQWHARLEEYIDALSDDTVLIGVNCHC